MPLVVMLHGGGGTARHGLDLLERQGRRRGFLVLALQAERTTWDVVTGAPGVDVARLDTALAHVFATHDVDARHIAIAGFSDGASAALSLGLANGDVFTHVLAWSPGFVRAAPPHGAPRVYVSHGDDDDVLPVELCSRRVVPRLRAAGYDVRYDEFDGPHTVPARILDDALAWFLGEP